MSQETKDRVYFVLCFAAAIVIVFANVAIIGGFVMARLLGLPNDPPAFYQGALPSLLVMDMAIVNNLMSNNRPIKEKTE